MSLPQRSQRALHDSSDQLAGGTSPGSGGAILSLIQVTTPRVVGSSSAGGARDAITWRASAAGSSLSILTIIFVCRNCSTVGKGRTAYITGTANICAPSSSFSKRSFSGFTDVALVALLLFLVKTLLTHVKSAFAIELEI